MQSASFAIGWLGIMLGVVGLPLGVPPEKEDAMLSRVAPSDTMLYLSWQGMAAPDATGKNYTEKFLAEPEIQRLVPAIEKIVRHLLQSDGPNMQPGDVDTVVGGVKLLLTRPTAGFISKLDKEQGIVEAGALVNVGLENREKVAAILEKIVKQTGGDAKTVPVGRDNFYRWTVGPKQLEITAGLKGNYLLVGIGKGSVEGMLERAPGQPPAWFTKLREQLPVPRVSTIAYANATLLRKFIESASGAPPEELAKFYRASGLDGVTALGSVAGLDETGCVSRGLIEIDGPARGFLKFFDAPGLSPTDLPPLAADSAQALALRVDPAKVFQWFKGVMADYEPAAVDRMKEDLASAKAELGFDIEADLLAGLGDAICIGNEPAGGLTFGWVGGVKVRDRAKLQAVIDKVGPMLAAQLAGPGRPGAPGKPPEVRKLKAGKYEIQSVSLPGAGVPISPAWCLTENWLLIGTTPNMIEPLLERTAKEELLVNQPLVAARLSSGSAPISFAYVDLKQVIKAVYPLAQIGLGSAIEEAQRAGVPLEASILPRLDVLTKHLQPSVSSVKRTAAGIEFTQTQTLPNTASGALVVVGPAVLLPAVQAARTVARRMQSQNNEKQIMLALLNYESATRGYPPAYNTDKEGKPLLSWRVMILPFIEEQALYDQFHFDEPWDSEHNKKLIAKMPLSYRSPVSRAEVGKTTYLAVRAKDSVLAPPTGKADGKMPRGLGIEAITDGTSNTVVIVETNDDAAVVWTKPDDYEYDPKAPGKALRGVYPGDVTNVAFADGSVRVITSAVDPKVLLALFTRNGGEAIDNGALDGPPQTRRTPPPRAIPSDDRATEKAPPREPALPKP